MPSEGNHRIGTVDDRQPAETGFCPICQKVAMLHAYRVPAAVPTGLGGGGERFQLVMSAEPITVKICAGCGGDCAAKQIGVTIDGQVTVGGKLASEANRAKAQAEFHI